MIRTTVRNALLTMLTLSFLQPEIVHSDEGMWLFNNLPQEYLQTKYGFTPGEEWAEHLMRSSVRFDVGGSASFVSSNGLVLTNHHVGLDTIQKLTTAERNLIEEGFYAPTLDDELPAPDLELSRLVAIQDVTEKVQGAVKSEMSDADAVAARRAAINEIEKRASEATGNRCDVVTLYGGGRYHLYEYQKYNDVRLVWCPESAAAFFGGDADNFEYPRYCLDACLFRVYEDGKPAEIEHFLKWNPAGPEQGELVFVSGNPGRTSRIYTHAALQHERDVRMPYLLNFIRRREILLQQFALEGEQQERISHDELMGFQNSRKAYMGMLQGLQDPRFMQQKREEDEALLEQIAANPDLQGSATAWQEIEEIQARKAELQKRSISLNTRSFNLAQTLVRLAAEDQKPNSERLPQYTDAARPSLQAQLLSPAPLHTSLELTKLADLLARNAERLGGDHPLIQQMLAGQSPRDRARTLLDNTRIADVEFRRELFEGAPAAIEECDDPMLELVRIVEPTMRQLQDAGDELSEAETQAYAQIADALFAIKGTQVYPDATFTLRLAFGVVKGYEEDGQQVPAWTTLGGAFEHQDAHNAQGDWKLPETWMQARGRLDETIPYNFVCTADIIGGNSGSPVVNRAGELVGLIFDGNVQSLTSDFLYSDKQARATSVHAGAIMEALRNVYDAGDLADQLGK